MRNQIDSPAAAMAAAPTTSSGREWLKEEIRRLSEEVRPEAARTLEEMTRAQDLGDITSARAQLEALDMRISQLERRLRASEAISRLPSSPAGRVGLGDRVTCIDDAGEKRVLILVDPEEADPTEGLISWSSPIARALDGASVGDEVEAQTPRGSIFLEIIEISSGEAVINV